MPIVSQKLYKRSDAIANRNILYIFGDNEERYGYGGQAGEMRDEPNAVGVATLSFLKRWSDEDAARQCRVIDGDLFPVLLHLLQGGIVVFPEDGIGTGIAKLAETSPITMQYVLNRMAKLRKISRSPARIWAIRFYMAASGASPATMVAEELS